MIAIRRVAIISCTLVIGILMGELGFAQTRIIRQGSRIYRVVPSPSAQSRTIRAASQSRTTPRRAASSSASKRTSTAAGGSKSNKTDDASNEHETIDNDIPKAALATQRGIELAAQLESLRHAEKSLGSRHPSMPDVRKQIANIRRVLMAWESEPSLADLPETDLANELPPSKDDALAKDLENEDTQSQTEDQIKLATISDSILNDLSKDDLKKLVVRLATDVSKLRRRLNEIELQLSEDES